MKNKLLVAFLLMVAASFAQVCAQVDTIRGKVPYFHYNYYDSNWCESQIYSGELCLIVPVSNCINKIGVDDDKYHGSFIRCQYNNEVSEIAIRMDMDSATEISGIAIGYNTQYQGGIGDGFLLQSTVIMVPQYNTEDYIFNIYDESMELLLTDTVLTVNLGIDFYVEAGFAYGENDLQMARDMFYHGHAGYEAPAYIGICKIEFDTVIQVPETFYIGITSTTPLNTSQDTMLVVTALYERFGPGDSVVVPYETRRYRIAHSSGEEIQNWADEECHYGIQTCLYPILVLPCGEVTGLRCQAVGGAGTVALVEWDSGENNTAYEVSFGPRGTPPGEGTVTTVTVPRLVHSLDRNTHYDFYVRARCDLADTTWTAWSDPLHVHLATMSINGAEPVDWSLTPNPAHGSATVRCEEGIRSVELLTVKGEILMQRDVAGEQTCALDLTGLSKGIYIVQITTPQGTAARKLAVD